jgi:hypothetical protein
MNPDLRSRSDDRGAVLPLVVLMLVGLLAVSSLAIDVGFAYEKRQRAQNTADAAALAGAAAIAGGPATAIAEARSYIDRNGFAGSLAAINLPPTSGTHVGNPQCIEVIPEGDSSTFFAQVIGIESFDVDARSTACSTQSTGLPALFARGTNCGTLGVDWPGSSTVVSGAVHSNAGIKVGGSGNQVQGPGTYLGTLDAPSDKISWSPSTANPTKLTTALASPAAWTYAEYLPGGARAVAAGTAYVSAGSSTITTSWLAGRGYYNTSTKVIRPGLYVTTGSVDLSDSDIKGLGVTIVAGSTIKLSGSNQRWTPFEPSGLLLFANYRAGSTDTSSSNCTSFALMVSGSASTWEGTMYAPRSAIELSGSSNSALTGSLLGYALKLNGSGLRVSAGAAATARSIDMVE